MSDRTDIPPGLRKQLESVYEFERAVGSGGMGVVWLARERLLDRRVAIKFLLAGASADTEAAHRFLIEARIAAKLQHPGVVGLLSFGEHEGARYLVMPFVEGESLAARLARGPLPESEARRILADLADALHHVHTMGIVHRDVKPANVLLDQESGRVRLTDFGIARALAGDGVTSTGMVVGTPAYLAPEQIASDGSPVDGRADIYALGVVAYELACGRPPFEGGTSQETLARHLADVPPALRTRAPAVSEEYERVVLRCLAKAREDRWSSARELATAFSAHSDGDPDPVPLRPIRSALAHGLILSAALAAWGPIGLSAIWPEGASVAMRVVTILLIAAVPTLGAFARIHEVMHDPNAEAGSWRTALKVALRVPDWWSAWWPRRWCSPLERIDALPPRLRSVAWWGSSFMSVALAHLALQGTTISSIAALSASEFAAFRGSSAWDVLSIAFLRGIYVVGLLGVGFGVSLFRARAVIAASDRKRASAWMKAPRSHATWRDPLLLSLLTDASGSGERVPATFAAVAEEIEILHDRLKAAGWRLDDVKSLLGSVRAARRAWEDEAIELRRDVDLGEAERLRARLGAIEAGGGARAEQQEMRELLRKQLALHERQRDRLVDCESRLDRLHASLTLLWRQLRALRADDVAMRDSDEVTGRVRALIEDVTRLRDSSAGTHRLMR